jgi:hypothetical protein
MDKMAKYEAFKMLLKSKGLTPAEYEKAIREFCRKERI